MSEFENRLAAGHESLDVSELIALASDKISFEKACRFIDCGICEMWQGAHGLAAPDQENTSV
jgi:hypothetical protein